MYVNRKKTVVTKRVIYIWHNGGLTVGVYVACWSVMLLITEASQYVSNTDE